MSGVSVDHTPSSFSRLPVLDLQVEPRIRECLEHEIERIDALALAAIPVSPAAVGGPDMSGIESLDVSERTPAYRSMCFGILRKLTAVMEYGVPVAGHVDVRLDDVRSLLEGEADGCECVVRCVGRRTAVCEDEWLTREKRVPRRGEGGEGFGDAGGAGGAAAPGLGRTSGVRGHVSGL